MEDISLFIITSLSSVLCELIRHRIFFRSYFVDLSLWRCVSWCPIISLWKCVSWWPIISLWRCFFLVTHHLFFFIWFSKGSPFTFQCSRCWQNLYCETRRIGACQLSLSTDNGVVKGLHCCSFRRSDAGGAEWEDFAVIELAGVT